MPTFTVKFHRMHKMSIFAGIPVPTGKISMIVCIYIGMPTLIVEIGKILLFAWGAYFHSRMLIFTVKMGTRMPIFTSIYIYIYI